MDLENEAIELQKVFHRNHKTFWEETKAIKEHLETRFKILGLTPSCKKLKVKKTLNFRDWTEKNDIGLDENGQWFINGKGDVDIDTLIDMHVRDVYL